MPEATDRRFGESRIHQFPMAEPGRPSIGQVVSVEGSNAIFTAPFTRGNSGSDNSVGIGKLVSVGAGDIRSIAMIYATALSGDSLVIKAELVGQIATVRGAEPRFSRGVAEYPAIGEAVFEINSGDLAIIFTERGPGRIAIGRLVQDPSIVPTLKSQDLVQKHFAVLGTTGCGKSTTVSLLLHEILKSDDQVRILMIDPHNEFKHAFGDEALVVSPANLNLPFWLFNFEEIVDVIYRRRPGVEEEVDALADLIPIAKARFAQKTERVSTLIKKAGDEDSGHTVDSPVPYRMADVIAQIDEQLGKLDAKADRPKLRRLKGRIESIMQDPRYQFMFSGRATEDLMVEILRTLFRVPAEGKRVTILELAGFPAEVVDPVVSVLCRLAFDLGVWSEGRIPILVVCEEAHRYVPADKRLGFGPTRRSISRIAKEGRKYGVSLGVISQRPAEIDATVLSQCSTVFAMRLVNEADHAIIRSAVSDAAASTLQFLPTIGNREAIAFGEAVPIPMRVRFTNLAEAQQPRSFKAGDEASAAAEDPNLFLDDVVRRWRRVASRGG